MLKGILIMLAVFMCVAILHFTSLRIMKLSPIKKKKIKKLFWYFYGVYFLAYGIYLNISSGFDILGILFILIALLYIIFNYLDKFETK